MLGEGRWAGSVQGRGGGIDGDLVAVTVPSGHARGGGNCDFDFFVVEASPGAAVFLVACCGSAVDGGAAAGDCATADRRFKTGQRNGREDQRESADLAHRARLLPHPA